jgi:uncharacterized protein (DUF433 family)
MSRGNMCKARWVSSKQITVEWRLYPLPNLENRFKTSDYASFFKRRSDLCGGEAVLTGTRATALAFLASLAQGASILEILTDFPTLTEAAVRAIIAFAAVSAEEDLPVPAAPAPA